MKLVSLVFLLVLMLSCSGNRLPKNILRPEKMQEVMWDLSLADELVNFQSSRDSSWMGDEKHREYYQKVFSIHKITQEEFARSLEYYESHPPMLKSVLDSVQKTGERRQKAYDSILAKRFMSDTASLKLNSSPDSLKKKRNLIRGL